MERKPSNIPNANPAYFPLFHGFIYLLYVLCVTVPTATPTPGPTPSESLGRSTSGYVF